MFKNKRLGDQGNKVGRALENARLEVTETDENTRLKRSKQPKKWKYGIGAVVVVGVLAIAGMYYHQSTRFNSHITINGTKVGGLTADQAIKKLGSSVLKNEVYVGKEKIYDGTDTKMGFTSKDLPGVQKILSKQRTFFPSSKAHNYSLMPSKENQYRTKTLKEQVKNKIIDLNKGLKAPQDAKVKLEQGQIVVAKSVSGKQYDVEKILAQYKTQEYKSSIYLKPEYLQPLKADNPIIKKEKKTLKEVVGRTVKYTVQNKTYSLKGSDLIKNASISKNGKITIDSEKIENELDKINDSQSTLHKNFLFKTHSGSVISVKGQSYGWAINVEKEAARIKEAFEKGQDSLQAEKVYGEGWSTYGIGYDNTTNHGIGDTYAEVSIQEQRIWLYRNGKLVLTTHVVTGRHDTNEDTNKGVWYVEYKETPSILRGSETGNPNYSVKVQYWAPFTLGGQGFHDAPWRSDWSSTAYLHHGSGGCVNTPPSIMKTVYDNLSKNEPVIVY